ncbi:MAG: hypothetical protein HQM01_10435 [Magnetococcales bacterium]|nr:hypothetical protein [Magnetococcales bacterium]
MPFRDHHDRFIEPLLTLLLLGLALWTATTHLIGLGLNGNFQDLSRWVWWIPFGIFGIQRLLGIPTPHPLPDPAQRSHPPQSSLLTLAQAATLVALFEFSTPYFPSSRLHLFWILAMLLLGRAWLKALNHPVGASSPPPPMSRGDIALLWLLVAGAVAITALAHRPDPDDQYYSNLAVMTLQHPERTLLSWNGMIWSEKPVTWMPIDRLPAIELLVAWCASLTHAEPITISHQFLAPLMAAFTVLTHAGLLRLFVPTLWLRVLIIELFLLLAIGGEIRASYSIFSFVQLHFGKSILFSTLAPLLLLLALRYMRDGTRRNWLLLFFGQMAALGCSSSALFLAPATVGLGLTALWRPDKASTRRLFVGLLSTLYPLALGMGLFVSMTNIMQGIDWSPLSVEQSLMRVLGQGVNLWLHLLALLAAWTLLPPGPHRRILLGLSFIFTTFFLNPFLYPFLATHVTGPVSTWRLLFALPLTALTALMIVHLAQRLVGAACRTNQDASSPATSGIRPDTFTPQPIILSTPLFLGCVLMVLVLSHHPRWRGFWSEPFSLAGAMLVILLLAEQFQATGRMVQPRAQAIFAMLILSTLLASVTHLAPPNRRSPLTAPRTLIHWPGIKAPEREFTLARQIVAQAPQGQSALVPENLGVWVTTLRNPPPLVALSRSYLEQSHAQLEPNALERRLALLAYISGQTRPEEPRRLLTDALAFYRIGLVALEKNNPWREEIDTILLQAGFQGSESHGILLWIHPPHP